MTAINSNRAIRGPVTAVPVVAGKGVRLVADTENNRVVAEADETVLWEGIKTNSCLLSEDTSHFEKIGVFIANQNDDVEEQIIVPKGSNYTFATIGASLGPNNAGLVFRFITVTSTSMTVTKGKTMYLSYNDSGTSWSADTSAERNNNALVKVVGINRVSA